MKKVFTDSAQIEVTMTDSKDDIGFGDVDIDTCLRFEVKIKGSYLDFTSHLCYYKADGVFPHRLIGDEQFHELIMKEFAFEIKELETR